MNFLTGKPPLRPASGRAVPCSVLILGAIVLVAVRVGLEGLRRPPLETCAALT